MVVLFFIPGVVDSLEIQPKARDCDQRLTLIGWVCTEQEL